MELPPNLAEREQQALTLTIKTPNQAFGDQTVPGVVLTWTVKELKTHLTRIYPSHPPEKDQRLIYSGKLLPDHLHMKDIFRKSDTQPTLHLVCSFKPPLDLHQPTQAKLTERNPRVDSAHGTPSQAVGAASPPAAGDGLRHRGNLQHGAAAWTHPAMHTGGDPQSHPGFAAYSMYNPQQLLWLQQMYARQYYMHYQAALAAAAASPPAPSPQSLPVVPHGAPALADQAPVNQNIAPPAPVNPGANQNLRMNAQGGPVMEEEEELNRDWLDWLYTASRFSVFLSILYFYSSVSRFVMVMSALMVLYLYTAGWFPFRQRPAQPVPNNPVPARAAEDIQNQENQENQENQNRNNPPEDMSGEGQEQEQGQAEAPLPATLPERRSVVSTAWVFFKTFFSSLIPEGPQAIAN
ncbi:homocysteine-responsive endoplasmic reticulum-resident ubiquitin-like domain member 1 protein [Acipenser ruthenus]|uniref:homocysteine-responsive endoplasmic reticulum-resident ubiquitin-like domain member 1 protein n=1 Tax=Acipenser ruthenus TaxID=7906 RepID=UPI0027429473|nr:homocysteine-responsive endoplasmic reticulum-resident ubiquitin-like domain member 1 protein [Acipenser ruthenus]